MKDKYYYMNQHYDFLTLSQEEIERFELYYPQINSSIVPLSYTGVSPRNFFAWKDGGLIELSQEKNNDERKWVKLNLVEYLWVKIIQNMRDFGMSYDLIKLVKEIMFANSFELAKTVFENFLFECNTTLNYTDDQIAEIKNNFEVQRKIEKEKIEKGEISPTEQSIIFKIIIGTLLKKGNITLLIVKDKTGFLVDVTAHNKLEDINKLAEPSMVKPHFAIPILGLLLDFFDDPKSEVYCEQFGFINPNEKKVLEAIRKNNFEEIHIKSISGNDMAIDVITSENITDEKAIHIRKILGLNEYDEINLKYRNSKNLYVKNKKRLN